MSEHEDSVRSVVEIASVLDDREFLAMVRAVVEQRPGLSALLEALDVAASTVGPITHRGPLTVEDVDVSGTVVEAAEIVDAPVYYSTSPTIPEPDYTDGGVPTFDTVREKIEGRVAMSYGSAELAHENPAGKSVDEQWDERQKAAKVKLEEIRRSMGK